MASVLLRADVILMQRAHRCGKQIHIARSVLVNIAFMRAVSEIGHRNIFRLRLFSVLRCHRQAEFQAESGKEREYRVAFSFQNQLHLSLRVNAPYRMQAQERLYHRCCDGKVTGDGRHILADLCFRAVYLHRASVIPRLPPFQNDVPVVVRGRPPDVPFHRSGDAGFPVLFHADEISLLFAELVMEIFS